MATSTIKATFTKGTATDSNQQGASGEWVKNGNICVISGTISHAQTSWTILEGFPRPKDADITIGVLAKDEQLKYPVIMIDQNNQGKLQIWSTAFTESYKFSASYYCL